MDERNEARDIEEQIAALGPAERTAFAEAAMGRDALDFLKTDLGRYLVGCAKQEAEDATHELKTVWPWRKRRITELQNRIWRAESFSGWLADLILQGKAAEMQLDEREE
jgi:hypothetical protein